VKRSPEFVLRKFVSISFILTMYFSGGLIPTFLLMRDLHLIGTFSIYILPGLIDVFNLIVIRSFIEGLPEGILESARIDGAGEFITFLRIVLPLTVPVLATVSLFAGVYQWNSWFDVFLYNSSKKHLSTLQYELMRILQNTNTQSSSRQVDFFAEAAGHDHHRLPVPAEIFRAWHDGGRREGLIRCPSQEDWGPLLLVCSLPVLLPYLLLVTDWGWSLDWLQSL